MCPYCHTLPHLPGCPNASETEARGVYECTYCGEMIKEGEEFYRIAGEFYHADCLEKALDVYDLLELLGINEEIAVGEVF